MKIYLIAALVAIFSIPTVLFAGECEVQFTTGLADMGKVGTNSTHSLTARIVNSSNDTVFIRGVHIAQTIEVFKADNVFIGALPPKSNRDFTFSAFSRHNLHYTAVAFMQLRCSAGEYSLPLTLSVDFFYPDSAYNFTQNLNGSALVSSLSSYLQAQTVFTYKQAREYLWGSIDNHNGSVECVYTGKTVVTKGIPDAAKFNTEHTWPQSKGSDTGAANTDLFHLYPASASANSARSNNPFGMVSNNIYWQDGGSKAGFPQNKNDSTFEPRDIHKGNVARSMFYYCTRYGNRKGKYDKEGFLTSQEETLRIWNTFDSVDTREHERNEAIYNLQKRRNPYIDHPEFIERINELSGQQDFPLYPRLAVSDERIVLSFFNSADQFQELPIYIANTGTETAVISSVEPTSNPDMTFQTADIIPKELQPGNWAKILIRAKRPTASIVEGTMKVRFADGLPSLSFFVTSTNDQPLAIQEASHVAAQKIHILGCSPNPVSDEATLYFDMPKTLVPFARIMLYSITGQKIAEIVPNIAHSMGIYSVQFNRTSLPSGAIIARIISNYTSDSRLIMLE